jgi:hypothetical protein
MVGVNDPWDNMNHTHLLRGLLLGNIFRIFFQILQKILQIFFNFLCHYVKVYVNDFKKYVICKSFEIHL